MGVRQVPGTVPDGLHASPSALWLNQGRSNRCRSGEQPPVHRNCAAKAAAPLSMPVLAAASDPKLDGML